MYPNVYAVGMDNLGFQTLYGLLNSLDRVSCERVFLPQTGAGGKTPVPRTLESNRPAADFDVIAFSVSFENDYPNILTILDGAGIPFVSTDRTRHHPLVMAGGVACFINPEPIADFMDCMVIGEAEPVMPRFFEIFAPDRDRETNLKNLADHVAGIYVPAFYEPGHGREKVRRVFAENLSDIDTTSTVLSAHTGFGHTFLIETGRGCPHGCRFCSAGYIYRPLRFRRMDQLSRLMARGIEKSSRVGLVGAAITDLPDLIPLCEMVSSRNIRVSFSSLRADRLSDAVIDVLVKSRVKTATIAPDAGSERMRRVIKKGLTENQILAAAENLVAAGIPNLKLYFMVGLPTETADDVMAIVTLCRKIKKVFLDASRIQKRIGTITVSLNPFVPKPFTPFQWAAMDNMRTAKQKIKSVKKGLKGVANVRVIAESPRWSHVQGLLSRGDRQTGHLLRQVYANGGNWAGTMKNNPLANDEAILRARDVGETLAWEFIDQGFDRALLEREYEKALGKG